MGSQHPDQEILLASEHRHVRLRLSVKGMRVIDRRGIETVVAQLRARGEKI